MISSELPDGVTAATPCYALVFRDASAADEASTWFFEISPVDGHFDTIASGSADTKPEAEKLCRARVAELGLSSVSFRTRSRKGKGS
ncbi:hypothetical protein H7J07_05215 [Mycobacterium koreense]|uniref:Uncharacterized protein n=1 Tax=Mycolicibacillus koreensis TaxID=1069220 RepID=A0A7I7SBA7_9MYCO|nr:hypothetical protein [Mycolicibacillus koreensis]MCV7247624.1 hypothetical protein [Mycolicibacillus koreensis]OSC32800.1 hypothetical protein B8W67_13685 [Mycolicibacillus koreensis]BBY54003.1 hypothetical protein MKOR_12540 [Mycolicibacillus koreensis]